jgi:predicted transcriptional regulator/ribosome-associated translation inhibitor RaiA
MDIAEISEAPLVFLAEDSVSRVASGMLASGKRSAVIMDGAELLGVVHATDLVKKRIGDPEDTKIRKFAVRMGAIAPGTSVEEAVNGFLINDYHSMPVEIFDPGKRLMILTKFAALKGVMNGPALKGKKAGDVMSPPFSITPEDSVATARAIIRDMGISGVVVVSQGKALGIVGVLDLLAPLARADSTRRDAMFFHKDGVESVQAASFMRKDIPRAGPEAPLAGVVETMVSQKSPVIVEKGGVMAGMISPTDVLKLVGAERRGIYVNITGLQEEDDFIKGVVDDEISASMSRVVRYFPVQWLAVHVERHSGEGSRKKYSVRCRLITDRGVLVSGSHAWDLTKAFSGALARLEREAVKKKERPRDAAVRG